MNLAGQKITILGAGIGGLTSAIALAQKGARVHVLEQAPEIREFGAGLQISPNGAAVLEALGLGAELNAIGTRAEAVALRDYRAGAGVLRLDLTRQHSGAGYNFVHRADLIAMLARAARSAGVSIRLLHKVTDIAQSSDGRATIRTAQGAQVRADILIGADGLHSVTRTFLNGKHAPFFTGQVAWRAVVPAAAEPLPAAEVFMGPGRHLVTYPLRGGSQINIVAVEERRAWADEGWSHQDDPDNMRAAFSGFCPEVRALLDQVDTAHIWGLFRHPVAPVWAKGNVAILGDAAHPTLPFLAQGAVMALEDAWVLADALTHAETAAKGLASYQKRREARVKRVVDTATRNARNYHLRTAPVRFVAHSALRLAGSLAPNQMLGRFDWLYGHDVTKT